MTFTVSGALFLTTQMIELKHNEFIVMMDEKIDESWLALVSMPLSFFDHQ